MSGRDFVRSLSDRSGLAVPERPSVALIDPLLMAAILAIIGYGLVVLYSAVEQDMATLRAQALRLSLALVAMLVAAVISPRLYLRWAPALYVLGLAMLVGVLLFGVTAKGAQRWLEIPGVIRFQPSELMKLAVPLMVAWYLHDRLLPPRLLHLCVALALTLVPAFLIVRQPDLGTGILIAGAGLAVIVLAGLPWRLIGFAVLALALAAPGFWYLLEDYQRSRIVTLFDPESDPLGAGWNIIQSKTAIGSGGVFGKGLLQGTQSQLDFLPESQTDFIIAVIGEELGLVGVLILLLLYLVVVARGLFMSTQAPSTFARLVAGALTLTFFVYAFVNIAMVCGLLPVVGVPLPLVSYGGTSAITLLAGFGIVMAMHAEQNWHRGH
ncbi:MAG: rod shape-determining protein RodA [Pseudomonadota bacterium]